MDRMKRQKDIVGELAHICYNLNHNGLRQRGTDDELEEVAQRLNL
jgi:hypothetical protein